MIVDAEFGPGASLDLIVDDASHDLELTRASFNALFPRSRPGGVFVIEDWAWAHVGYGVARPDDTPLSVLVFEVLLGLAARPLVIEDTRVTRDWAVVRRGPEPLNGPF